MTDFNLDQIIVSDPIEGGVELPYKLPDWYWSLDSKGSIRFGPEGGSAPNAFHRWMQRVFLGIRWERAE